jgi:GAF domain-containing protein
VTEGNLRAAVAASALAGEDAHVSLLQSIVEVARAIFEAKAASITLYDTERDELVFEAVAGEGQGSLVGNRFSASEGVAGFVLRAQEPLVIDDIEQDPRFARDVAEETGYVPNGLMAAPLLSGETAVGVLSVLDRPAERAFSLAELDLLAMFARQAALALEVVQRAREAGATLSGDGESGAIERLARSLARLEGERRAEAVRLLDGIAALMDPEPGTRSTPPGLEGSDPNGH